MAYGLMSSDDSVDVEMSRELAEEETVEVQTWNLIAMQANLVNRSVVSIALDFRLLEILVHLLAMLFALTCED